MASQSRLRPVEEALSMHETQEGVFELHILSDYCFGDWAWGGFDASLVHTAAAKFTSKDANTRHPDVVNMQIQYLRPLLSKKAAIFVRTVRITRPILTVHVAITQDSKECVVGYVNLSDLNSAEGPTYDTKWTLQPHPAPANIAELENNTSRDWIRYTTPYTKNGWFRPHSLVYYLLPIQQIRPSISEAWFTPSSYPENTFTNETLGMIADAFPPFMENFVPGSTINHQCNIEIAKQQKADPNGESELSNERHRKGWNSPFVLTTLSLTLEIKKRLPTRGVKWLFVRAYAKTIAQGKYDIEVLIMDENQDLIAVSHQIALAAEFRAEQRDKSMAGLRAKV